MIKYIGSKRMLIPHIRAIVNAAPDITRVCDLFTGTTRVAHALKDAGYEVIANDMATYSHVIATALIATDVTTIDMTDLNGVLDHLNDLDGIDGYITRTFCEHSRYFQPHNGRRIDAIRGAIDDVAADDTQRAILLTSLLLAADRVDSTTGLQMAYLKQWSPRSSNPLQLRMPALLAGPGQSLNMDANELAPQLTNVDLVYVDPPYNQHSYYSNYHIWETIVRGDAPETYGIACKRLDCRTTKSDYNSRRRCHAALRSLLLSLPCRYVLVSFSDEGFVSRAQIEEMLVERAAVMGSGDEVAVLGVGSRRYVGARIGIHDPKGRRVGKVSHVANTEFLFLAGPGANEILETAAHATAERPKARGVLS